MSREIKFRIWDKELKYMHKGSKYHSMGLDEQGLLKGDNLIFMQYTGLKDNSGKEIYEGDIIKREWRDWGEEPHGIVRWISKEDGWDYSGWYAHPSELPFKGDDSEVWCKIIGNIYQDDYE